VVPREFNLAPETDNSLGGGIFLILGIRTISLYDEHRSSRVAHSIGRGASWQAVNGIADMSAGSGIADELEINGN
jgi:hypothetical protein